MLLIILLFIAISTVNAVQIKEVEEYNTELNLDTFIFDIADLLGFKTPIEEKCTIISLGFVLETSVLPTVYLTSPSAAPLPNNCYYVIIRSNHHDISKIQIDLKNLTRVLKRVPKMVLTIVNKETTSPGPEMRVSCPWVHVTNWNIVRVTCPGCGTSKMGIWRKNQKHPKGDKFSKNLFKPVCCHPLRGKEVRITYINPYTPYFQLIGNKLDLSTLEGQYLQLFIDKLDLTPSFLDANFQWGNKIDGKWNGIVGNLGYNRSDIGVTFLSITGQRAKFIDYTMPVTPDNFCWITKPPGPLPPYLNLLIAFDIYSWSLFGLSILSIILVLFIVTKVGGNYGIKQPEISLFFLIPFGMVNAEYMPNWFDRAPKHKAKSWAFGSPGAGFSGNLLLLTWAFMGMDLMFAFTCNLLSLIVKVEPAPPIDDSKQLIESGTKIHLLRSAWYYNYLSTSSNEWHIKATEDSSFYQGAEAEKQLVMNIAKEGGKAILRSNFPIISKFINDPDFADLPPVHFSKETVRPYYGAWGVQKMSPWKEAVNKHLLIMDQAGLRLKLQAEILHELNKKKVESQLEPLSLDHIFGPSILLMAGIACSTMLFLIEITCRKKYGKSDG